jgi:hypothetical protein
MNNTWFAQLVVAFILAAVAGLYLVPRTLSAEEMNQIVGACGLCNREHAFPCTGNHNDCADHEWIIAQRDINGRYSVGSNEIFCNVEYGNVKCLVRNTPRCKISKK